MKINLNFQIKNLQGEEIKGEFGHAGKVLANMLAQQSKGNSIKLYDWALKLWNSQALELDDVDAGVLYALVENSETLTIIAKVPIMKAIKK